MKEPELAVSRPAEHVQSAFRSVKDLFDRFVVPSYGRFEIALARGEGSRVWDVYGKEYLDLGGGIAVCSLGHCHPIIAEALAAQARTLIHVSNLYYQEPQGRLASRIVGRTAPGRVFFCNSGAEANEGLFKLARKTGNDRGRYEIITALNSFHGRTLAGISATGQDKVKKGFEPMVEGFRHVPFNDLDAARAAITPKTAAILVEGVQGEGGILPASPAYLRSLRTLCDEHGILLLMDGVQCGHFRTGSFHSFQRILEDDGGTGTFFPDGIAMAKSLGGGFPIGAFWVAEKHAGTLSAGTHGTTYGGSPLACAAAQAVFDVIEREKLADNARDLGAWMKARLIDLSLRFPQIITAVRGLGLMIGIQFAPKDAIPALASVDRPASLQICDRLHDLGLLTVPSGAEVIRLLPALNLSRDDAARGIAILERLTRSLA